MTDIEKALEVMGATKYSSDVYDLLRMEDDIATDFRDKRDAALFLHECRLFLREKGYIWSDQGELEPGLFMIRIATIPKLFGRVIEAQAPTECEAFAQAVIRAGEEGRED